MTKFNAEGMEKLELSSRERQDKLTKLMKTPFDFENQTHKNELTKYIVEFESYANKIYVARGLTYTFQTYLGYRAFNFVFPILPDVVSQLLTLGLVAGMSGLAYKEYNATDFNNRLKEMRSLYNWALKGKENKYNTDIDNSKLLTEPLIQRMIEIMAPFCSTEFMIAWPKLVDEEEDKKSTSLLGNVGYYGSYALSLFSSAPKQDLTQSAKVLEIKTKVETRGYDIGVLASLKNAISYFISDNDAHSQMKASLPAAWDLAKETILEPCPEVINYRPKLM